MSIKRIRFQHHALSHSVEAWCVMGTGKSLPYNSIFSRTTSLLAKAHAHVSGSTSQQRLARKRIPDELVFQGMPGEVSRPVVCTQ